MFHQLIRRFNEKISSRFKPSVVDYLPKYQSWIVLLSDSRGNSVTNRCFNRLFVAGDVATVSSFGSLTNNTIQYNTIQYNTIQYNTIQYNTIQYKFVYNTIQYNTIQYNTIQYNTSTIQYNTIQYKFAMF